MLESCALCICYQSPSPPTSNRRGALTLVLGTWWRVCLARRRREPARAAGSSRIQVAHGNRPSATDGWSGSDVQTKEL